MRGATILLLFFAVAAAMDKFILIQIRSQGEGDLQSAIRGLVDKLKWQQGEAKERGTYLITRHKELTELLKTSSEKLVELINKNGKPYVHKVAKRLAKELKEAEKAAESHSVCGELRQAESLVKRTIPELVRFGDKLIGQLKKAREMVAALGTQGKALIPIMIEGLEHDVKEASATRNGANQLLKAFLDVKAKVAKEHPKLDKLGFQILDLAGNLTEKMGNLAKKGRGFSTKVMTALENTIKKLDNGKVRRELQDHKNSISRDDVRLHGMTEKIGRQTAQGRDVMNDIQTYAMRYSSDFDKWMAENIEKMERIEELLSKA